MMALETVKKSDNSTSVNGDCDVEKLKNALNQTTISCEKAETETSEKDNDELKKSTSEDSPSSEEERKKDIVGKKKLKKERSKKQNKAKKEKGEDKDSKTENSIEDIGFTVQIQPPTGSPFDLQVSTMELVQEIHQLLMDREDTCHRTCFSLMLGTTTLDNFAELKTIEGLKEGSVIRIVEQPYTMREARIHVRHVRDLLKSLDTSDSYNGIECSSLSFLTTVSQGDILDKRNSLESVDCTPPDYILPGSELRPLAPLQPSAKDNKCPKCLRVLNLSPWNPPPGPRKLHGDLLYLNLVTLEGRRHHITASTWGFFVNLSSEDEFNPKPANPSYLSHSLIDLLNQLSGSFKRNFANLQKKRISRHPFERVATPYQVYSWLSPNLQHNVDSLRAEDAFSSKLGYEEHIPGQTRDWNEELQTTRELPRKTLAERLLRERAIFKVHSDFVSAATRGAVAVVDGNVMAINPGEDPTMQMFIWNNIFFSLGFDVQNHYKDVGGDAAAFVAPKNDLQGVGVYNSYDVQGLYTLGTVVIDYRGYRVTAQSIIPGILEREQEQSVVYGSIDFGKTITSHPKYMELLQKAAVRLKTLPHTVVNDKGEEVELCSSIECKGIIGNDGRHYILDLLRTFPPDVNFLPMDNVNLGPTSKKLGFPLTHKHKLATLRQELIDTYVETKLAVFARIANQEKKQVFDALAKQVDDSTNNSIEGSDNKKLEEEHVKKAVSEFLNGFGTSGTEKFPKAAKAVGSLDDDCFDMRFNPDAFSSCVKHADSSLKELEKQRQLIVDTSDFLLSTQIPNLVKDLSDHSASPSDGATLCDAIHSRGINLRYMGKIAEHLKAPEFKYMYSMTVSEMIIRAVRHIFIDYMQTVETICLSAGVAHFLNCFLSSCSTPHAPTKTDEVTNKKRKKKGTFNAVEQAEFASLTPKSLWAQIKSEIQSYFSFSLRSDSIDHVVEKYKIQKVSLLRRFCQKCGVQLLLRDYGFDSSRETFHDDDIMNLFPVVKHINPRASDAINLYALGQNKMTQGQLKDGHDLVSEALNLLNNVYGAMHPEISQCLRMVARVNYLMGDYFEALAYQQKATLMSERVNGIDHPSTITEYVHLSLYCFANHQVSVSLKLLYRARYLLLLIHGENHPEIALVDTNIGLILHAESQYSLSLQFLENALKLNIGLYGEKSLKVALGYHLVARTQSCMGDFRSALRYEKETFTIYKEQLGANHEKTKEADECLRHLTQQAVVMAKKINEAITGRIGMGLPPIQIQPPSMASVLELLNITNGIMFIQISPIEMERFRHELEKSHLRRLGQECLESSQALKLEQKSDDSATPSTETKAIDDDDECSR